MPSLEQVQLSMMTVLDHGPDHLPAELFKGSRAEWLRGMKIHANTVSHARLVALEDTFPRTRECLGHDVFNQLSRQYVEQAGVAGFALDRIGNLFPEFLEDQQIDEALPDLARVEWAWLESFHAAEAAPLQLADLAGLGENSILEVGIRLHPSVRTVGFGNPPHQSLIAEIPDIADAAGVLIARPHEQVLLSPLNAAQMTAIGHASAPTTICNLFAVMGEQVDDTELLPILISLIETGALTRISGELA